LQYHLWPEVFYGSLSLGALYSCLGLAWVLIYRTTRVMNFAIGEFAILAGYVVYTLISAGVNWWLAFAAAVCGIAALGGGTYVVLLRPLAGRPLWTPVTVTMGVAFVLDGVLAIKWSGISVVLKLPLHNRVFHLPGSGILTTADLLMMALCLLTFAGALAFLRLSPIGLRMRAAAELPLLASQSGINIDRIFAAGWALSSAAAAVAGIGYGFTAVLDPSLVTIGIIGFTPALLGGIDSVGGVVVGGFITALVTNFVTLYLGDNALEAVAALLILLVLFIRPVGIFGRREIERV
jgi:branched-chain amino acid transport system permease protein